MPAGRRGVTIAGVLALAAAACVAWGVANGATLPDATLLLSTALTVAWLFGHTLRIQPHDDLALIVVPLVVALGVGKPLFALGGALLGLAISAFARPQPRNRSAALVAGVASSAAVVAAVLLPVPVVPFRLGHLIVAAVAYTVVRTLLVSVRIALDERMAWRGPLSSRPPPSRRRSPCPS